MTNKRAAILGLAAPLVVALVLLLVAPAAAHHRSDHGNGGNGKGKSPKSSGPTENNDTNDGDTPNNVVDGGNAHPSGKDKSVEHGGSGNQGDSTSDPDDDGRGPDRSNGGADKPDGPGGVDLADQDGNNGCGNDDDFEDDNEGWCGKNLKAGGNKPDEIDDTTDDEDIDDETVVEDEVISDEDTCPDDDTMAGVVCDAINDTIATETVEDSVLGERVERPEVALSDTAVNATDGTAVVADSAERSPAVLPFTGSGVVKLLLVAVALLLLGLVMLKARRRA